jgi:hypothetical protein
MCFLQYSTPLSQQKRKKDVPDGVLNGMKQIVKITSCCTAHKSNGNNVAKTLAIPKQKHFLQALKVSMDANV